VASKLFLGTYFDIIPTMLDYEIERYSPGRRCPLTEDRCFSKRCENNCYGIEAAKQLKKSLPIDPSFAARAFNSALGDFPIETQKAADEYMRGESNLDSFEDFMDDRV